MGAEDYITYEQISLLYERLVGFRESLPSNSLYKTDYYEYVNEEWISENPLA